MCIRFFIVSLLSFAAGNGWAQTTFSNPLKSVGADPWILQKDGYYYFTHTTGKNIVLYKSKTFEGLQTAKPTVIWTPPKTGMYSKQIWAPELHFIKGRWYFYFAADDGVNENHRLYVLVNKAKDPFQGTWELKGPIADPSNKWAIDATVYRHRNKWYMAWSGWEGDTNGRQDLYLARMKNPWTVKGRRVRISSPTYDWETHGDLNDPDNPPHVSVNEGPQLLQNGKKLFMVFSASGCWTEHYGLGLLTFTGKRNLLDSSAWVKTPLPFFATSAADSVFAPGHNSFFTSPDGKEHWLLYHANAAPGMGCGEGRSPRAQPFNWNEDGTPNFGKPVRLGTAVPVPSGSTETY